MLSRLRYNKRKPEYHSSSLQQSPFFPYSAAPLKPLSTAKQYFETTRLMIPLVCLAPTPTIPQSQQYNASNLLVIYNCPSTPLFNQEYFQLLNQALTDDGIICNQG
ncbi:unnamed protein product [Hymenolepis diminuta]|uniref:Uncharacterized protein n=1 Tax=Hymenolepis diminuta TaxID=6216 RepID=A0A0R3SN31_HYMDI|nr:unnamed protein product [Hymenolepis diminuta]